MKLRDLLKALEQYDIRVRSVFRRPDRGVVYTLEGRLPEFPFRSRLTSYNLAAAGENDFIGRDRINALLLYFCQGQSELFASD